MSKVITAPLPARNSTGPRIRRALISVSDKTGIIEPVRALVNAGAEILSTGGTRAELERGGIAVRDVAGITGFPEMLDGRVKTLHPAIHGALLARRDDPAHMEALAARDIGPIDLLYVTLYPFEAAIAKGLEAGTVNEEVDIGGPALLRAGAKNADFVTVCSDLADLEEALAEMAIYDGTTTLRLRRHLAAKAFARTAAYDGIIAGWMAAQAGARLPPIAALGGEKRLDLRYGENPHQSAALYAFGPARPGAATARLVQGKALSFNNLVDADAAFGLVVELGTIGEAAAVIVKHANPAGAAIAPGPCAAFEKALAGDPVSAFGGVAAFNLPLEAPLAAALAARFLEVVIAPGASPDALALLAAKPNLRVLLTDGLPDPAHSGLVVRSIAGGLLVQTPDLSLAPPSAWRVVTRRAPRDEELADLAFAWQVAKHVRSNAIVLARHGQTIGIGAGQMSRVDSVRLAIDKFRAISQMERLAEGSVLASDAFFPFADGLVLAMEAGIRTIVQPGGSIRDAEVIAAADAAGAAMVFTGERHFRH